MKFSVRFPFTADQQQQSNNEDLLAGINQIGQYLYAGPGVPSFTPPGSALFFRTDSPEVYKYNGAWVVA